MNILVRPLLFTKLSVFTKSSLKSFGCTYIPISHFELLIYIFKMVLFLNKVTLHNDLSDSRGVPTCFSSEANPSDIATML